MGGVDQEVIQTTKLGSIGMTWGGKRNRDISSQTRYSGTVRGHLDKSNNGEGG